MNKPLIGITLDYEEPGNYSKFPWFAIRENYLSCVFKYNAIPFPLFHESDSIIEICQLIDGLILTGGNFDINPSIYNNKNLNSRNIKSKRTNFEMQIFNEFFIFLKEFVVNCDCLKTY